MQEHRDRLLNRITRRIYLRRPDNHQIVVDITVEIHGLHGDGSMEVIQAELPVRRERVQLARGEKVFTAIDDVDDRGVGLDEDQVPDTVAVDVAHVLGGLAQRGQVDNKGSMVGDRFLAADVHWPQEEVACLPAADEQVGDTVVIEITHVLGLRQHLQGRCAFEPVGLVKIFRTPAGQVDAGWTVGSPGDQRGGQFEMELPRRQVVARHHFGRDYLLPQQYT